MTTHKNFSKNLFFLVFIGFFWTYFANLLRMVIIVLAGHYRGGDALLWTHNNLGWIIFTLWVALFWRLFFVDIVKESQIVDDS